MAAPKKQTGKDAPRSRGRQPTFDREKALETALSLFRRHGYEGVSIAALTRKIGIAAPSLYHAFGSKEGLYREALRRYQGMGLSEAQTAECTSSYEAARKLLASGIDAVTRGKRPEGCMISSGLLTAAPENAGLAAHIRSERAAQRMALQKRIEKDIDAGIVACTVNAAVLARFCVALLQGISVQAIDGATRAELTDVMETALSSWPGRAHFTDRSGEQTQRLP